MFALDDTEPRFEPFIPLDEEKILDQSPPSMTLSPGNVQSRQNSRTDFDLDSINPDEYISRIPHGFSDPNLDIIDELVILFHAL